MLIGLHGVARSGKDTIYEIIKEDFEGPGVNVVRDAFADRLKVSAARALGCPTDWSVEQCVDFCNVVKERGRIEVFEDTVQYHFDEPSIPGEPVTLRPVAISGREYLQFYGTEAHREVFDQDFWVAAVLPDAWEDNYGRQDVSRQDVLVITDVRFPNEAERILDCGGSVWHVKRPSVEVNDGHASEKPLSPELITLTIENNSTIDALRAKVHHFVWAELSQQIRAQV